MAHSLSAKKRIRQNEKKRIANRSRKSQIKTGIKELEKALAEGNAKEAQEQYLLVARKLDKTAATSSMHKRTVARKKSRLAKKVNQIKSKKKV